MMELVKQLIPTATRQPRGMTMNRLGLLFLLLLCGCARSHVLGDDVETEVINVYEEEGSAGSPAPETIPEVTADEMVLDEGEDITDVEAPQQGMEGVPEGDTVLFEASPGQACSNRDNWITLSGHLIRWTSSVTISYPYSGATLTLHPDDIGEDGKPMLDWRDLNEISFRTHNGTEWEGMSRWVQGHYLIGVTFEGESSNEVGVLFQYCSDD